MVVMAAILGYLACPVLRILATVTDQEAAAAGA
jgi:hypothetical protein